MSFDRDIADAVQSAINDGMDPNDFLKAAWEAWQNAMAEKIRYDNEAFARATEAMEL